MLKNKKYFYRGLMGLGLLAFSAHALCWDRGVSLGYGNAKELGENYKNKGFILNATLLKHQVDSKLDLSLRASAARWVAGTLAHKNLWTAGIGAGARAYFTRTAWLSPYIEATVTPSYISTKTFGYKQQGSHFVFQDTLGFGVEIGDPNHQRMDINYMFIHYSNANLFTPNNGYDIPFVLNVGYLF